MRRPPAGYYVTVLFLLLLAWALVAGTAAIYIGGLVAVWLLVLGRSH